MTTYIAYPTQLELRRAALVVELSRRRLLVRDRERQNLEVQDDNKIDS